MGATGEALERTKNTKKKWVGESDGPCPKGGIRSKKLNGLEMGKIIKSCKRRVLET